MSYQWFRMYAEFATDPVVQSLAFDDQRHFVMLLCLKCGGLLDRDYGDPQQRIAMLRRALGLESLAFDEAKTRLVSARLIDGEWQPVNWAKRQYISDHDPTAAERKRRQRERHAYVTRDVTDESRSCHGSQNQNTESEKRERGRAKRSRRAPDDFVPDLDFARSQLPDVDAEREAQKFRDWEFKTPRSDWPATWRTWVGNCRESGRYARAPKTGGMVINGKPVEWQ